LVAPKVDDPKGQRLVSNLLGKERMAQRLRFRKILPLAQTAIAVSFGGWGLCLRTSVLNQPFFGSTLWNSTARFHVWPWPYKFAVIQNAPAFFVGLLFSWPIESLKPGLPEWVSLLPSLFLIPLLWYLIGAWLDRRCISRSGQENPAYWPWVLLCFVTAISLAIALTAGSLFGSYTTFIPLGVLYWLALGIAIAFFGRNQKRILA